MFFLFRAKRTINFKPKNVSLTIFKKYNLLIYNGLPINKNEIAEILDIELTLESQEPQSRIEKSEKARNGI